jgi:hypothetical protein
MYAFAPPGWSHDGSTLTIKQSRKKKKIEAVNAKLDLVSASN